MKKYSLYVGIDISKAKLDVCLIKHSDFKESYLLVKNNPEGIHVIISAAYEQEPDIEKILFCLENTGYYGMPLAVELNAVHAHYWIVSGLEIKLSKGISRGKTDKTDAKRIALYAMSHLHKLKRSTVPEQDLLKLHLLHNERDKLIKAVSIFKSAKELDGFLPVTTTRCIKRIDLTVITKLEASLKKVDEEILKILENNPIMQMQHKLITSIPCIGTVTTVYLIIVTRCFKAFDNWRKLACYAGVAPFPYQSGSSVNGPRRINRLGNRKLKRLLSSCAVCARMHDRELKSYYERKIKEGKAPMQVLNAVRCKLLSRIFAVVNRQTPYILKG